MLPKFDLDRTDFYTGTNDDRTRNRLRKILSLGMEEVGTAEFGIPGVHSGLYIESVWNYDDQEFSEYIDFVKGLIQANVTVKRSRNTSSEILPTGLPKQTKVIAYVSDDGDPSVGIFATNWEVECPFWKEDAEPEDYEYFRATLTELYKGYCEGRIHVFFNTDPTFIG